MCRLCGFRCALCLICPSIVCRRHLAALLALSVLSHHGAVPAVTALRQLHNKAALLRQHRRQAKQSMTFRLCLCTRAGVPLIHRGDRCWRQWHQPLRHGPKAPFRGAHEPARPRGLSQPRLERATHCRGPGCAVPEGSGADWRRVHGCSALHREQLAACKSHCRGRNTQCKGCAPFRCAYPSLPCKACQRCASHCNVLPRCGATKP